MEWIRHTVFGLSVCSSVCKYYLANNFRVTEETSFVFVVQDSNGKHLQIYQDCWYCNRVTGLEAWCSWFHFVLQLIIANYPLCICAWSTEGNEFVHLAILTSLAPKYKQNHLSISFPCLHFYPKSMLVLFFLKWIDAKMLMFRTVRSALSFQSCCGVMRNT